MRVYADSSAVVKRALQEFESDALELAFADFALGGDDVVSSTITWVEVSRAIRSRLDDNAPAGIADLLDASLSGLIECPLSEQVVGIARRLGPNTLRSLDAIHLATATLLDVDLICAYDARLLRSAEELGFRTISPGMATD